jgi:cell division septal protein FtsQ
LCSQLAFIFTASSFVCVANLDVDNSAVKLPQPPPENPRWARVPKGAVIVMIVILIAMALLSFYSNVQRWRRDKIETVIVTPIGSPSRTP